jgi:hypothetical protein
MTSETNTTSTDPEIFTSAGITDYVSSSWPALTSGGAGGYASGGAIGTGTISGSPGGAAWSGPSPGYTGPIRFMSDDDIKALAEECAVRVTPGDRLIVSAPAGMGNDALDLLASHLQHMGVTPVVFKDAYPVLAAAADSNSDSLDVKLTLLARVAWAWEKAPRLSLQSLLLLVIDSLAQDAHPWRHQLMNLSDEDFVAAIEAYHSRP